MIEDQIAEGAAEVYDYPAPEQPEPEPIVFRSAASNASGGIDCEVLHPEFGWIPYTASPDDRVEFGRRVWEAVSASEVANYVPPSSEELRKSMPSLSPRQIRRVLLSIGITEADVEAALEGDPDGLTEWRWATSFDRTHPLIISMGPLFDLEPDQIDDLWTYALTI